MQGRKINNLNSKNMCDTCGCTTKEEKKDICEGCGQPVDECTCEEKKEGKESE